MPIIIPPIRPPITQEDLDKLLPKNMENKSCQNCIPIKGKVAWKCDDNGVCPNSIKFLTDCKYEAETEYQKSLDILLEKHQEDLKQAREEEADRIYKSSELKQVIKEA